MEKRGLGVKWGKKIQRKNTAVGGDSDEIKKANQLPGQRQWCFHVARTKEIATERSLNRWMDPKQVIETRVRNILMSYEQD